MNFFERLEKARITSWNKKDSATTKRISEMLKECIFEPNINKSKTFRGFHKFMKDQEKCSVSSMVHMISLLKESRDKEHTKCQSKPNINNSGIPSKVIRYIHKSLSSPIRSVSKKDLTTDTSPILIRTKSKELTKNELNVINRLSTTKILKENYSCITDKKIIKKYEEEYKNILKSLKLEGNSLIDFNTMKQIMIKMKFSYFDFANETQQRELNQFFTQIFKSLTKKDTERLMILIAGILNIQLNSNTLPEDTLKLHKKYKELHLLRNAFKKSELNSPYKKLNKEFKASKEECYKVKPKSVYGFMYKRESPYTPDIHITRKLSKTQRSRNKEDSKTVGERQLRLNKVERYDDIIEKIIEQKKKRRKDQERVKSLIEGGGKKPILNIEINYENIIEVLPVYEGDTTEQLVNTFTSKHSTLLARM